MTHPSWIGKQNAGQVLLDEGGQLAKFNARFGQEVGVGDVDDLAMHFNGDSMSGLGSNVLLSSEEGKKKRPKHYKKKK